MAREDNSPHAESHVEVAAQLACHSGLMSYSSGRSSSTQPGPTAATLRRAKLEAACS